jgi:STE24 endopeptidase
MRRLSSWLLILGFLWLALPGAAVGQPAPSATFDVEAATDAYLARLTPEERERSDAYFEGGYWLQLWGILYTLGVAWLLLGTGLSARMRDLAERLTERRPLQTVFYSAQYIVTATILFFPLTVYQGFFREHQYGLATQTFLPWMRDQLVDLGLSVVLFPLLLIPLYGVFRKAPKTWWIWGAAIGVTFLMFIILIGPVYIDPLFNTYVPLEDEAVREPILSMARANGIDVDNVYQFDASRQTTRISANVSGFLGTMAIRLNDNLLDRCSLAEIREVMAHEMGHYVLNHIYETIIFFGIVLIFGFVFIRWTFEWVRQRRGQQWSVSGIGDLAGMPLLAALFALFFFLITPFLNTYIRVNEAEADLFALHAAREPEGAAEVALKLSEYRKLDPGPIEEWIFYDHPSGRSRIHMAMTWKAEHLDEEGDTALE